MMNQSNFRSPGPKKLTIILLAILVGGIGHFAIAKAYACQCGYQENGSSYSVSYVSTGGGCCSGNASNGLGFIDRTGNGEPQHGYIDGQWAQSLCCGR